MFPSVRALKLVKSDVNITNSTNLIQLTNNIRLTILNCCAPPSLRLAAHCVGTLAVIAASVTTSNPVTIGAAVHLVTEIYENC